MNSLRAILSDATWRIALSVLGAIILVSILSRALLRAFPARLDDPAEYTSLRDRYNTIETASWYFPYVGGWGALIVMLVLHVGNTPWLVGAVFGWMILAPLLFVTVCTLPRGFAYWRDFWRFHEMKNKISLRFLGPLYAALSLLGIISTIVIVVR